MSGVRNPGILDGLGGVGGGGKPSGMVEWARDLYQAADDLGYIVTEIRSHSVVLVRIRSHIEVEIASVLVSGPLLREMLRVVK